MPLWTFASMPTFAIDIQLLSLNVVYLKESFQSHHYEEKWAVPCGTAKVREETSNANTAEPFSRCKI